MYNMPHLNKNIQRKNETNNGNVNKIIIK